MSPVEQQMAIAEALGWRSVKDEHGPCPIPPGWSIQKFVDNGEPSFELLSKVPDYLHDLNAMYVAENSLSKDDQLTRYPYFLSAACGQLRQFDFPWPTVHASAAQRAEAFLKTKGLWSE